MKTKSPFQIAKAFYDGTLTEADREKMGVGMCHLIALAESCDPKDTTAKLGALRDLADMAKLFPDAESELRDIKTMHLIDRRNADVLITKLKIAEFEVSQMRALFFKVRDELYARIAESPTMYPEEIKLPREAERFCNKW